MAEGSAPKCPKCEKSDFETKTYGKTIQDRIVIVYCGSCGHIVGILPHQAK